MLDLGDRIRNERKALGLTLQQFARLLETSPSMLQRVETGLKSPTVDLLVEIANVCRKPIGEFLKQQINGYKQFDQDKHKTIRTADFEITIICPYGLISKDIAISHFHGKAGALIIPPLQKGYVWVYILNGEGIFTYDSVRHEVAAEQTLYYNAEKPHQLQINTALDSIRVNIGK